jgi:hypothetical protein
MDCLMCYSIDRYFKYAKHELVLVDVTKLRSKGDSCLAQVNPWKGSEYILNN